MRKCLTITLAFLLILTMSDTIYAGSEEHSQAETCDVHLIGGIFVFEGWYEYVFWTMGIDLDYHVSEEFMVTPDFWILNYKETIAFWFNPGLTLNFKIGNPGSQFFLGSGVTLIIPREGDSTDLCLKINAGYLTENIKVSVYLLTPFEYFFEDGSVAFGANLGFTL